MNAEDFINELKKKAGKLFTSYKKFPFINAFSLGLILCLSDLIAFASLALETWISESGLKLNLFLEALDNIPTGIIIWTNIIVSSIFAILFIVFIFYFLLSIKLIKIFAKIASLFFFIYFHFLFIPFLSLSLVIINNNNHKLNIEIKNNQLFLIVFIFSYVQCIVSILSCFLNAFFDNATRLYSKKTIITTDSQKSKIYLIFSISICFSLSFDNNTIGIISLFICLICSIYSLFQLFLLNDLSNSKIILILKNANISITFFGTLSAIFSFFSGYNFQVTELIVEVILIIIFTILLTFIINLLNRRELFNNLMSDKSPSILVRKLYYHHLLVQDFLSKSSINLQNSQVILTRFQNHRFRCNDETCLCIQIDQELKENISKINKSENSLKFTLDSKSVISMMKIANDECLSKFPKNFDLLLFNAFFYDLYLNKIWKSKINIENAEMASNSISNLNSLKDQNNEMKKKLKQCISEEKATNLKNLTLYEEILSELIKKQKEMALDSLEMWTLLSMNSIDPKEFYLIAIRVSDKNYEIRELFQQIINLKTSRIEFYKIYSIFQYFVLSSHEDSNKYLKEFLTMFENQKINNNLLSTGTNNFYFILSGSSKNLGTILSCSVNSEKLTGYSAVELIGSNITILMDIKLNNLHHKILQNSMQGNTDFYLEKVINCFLRHKKGFLIFVNIHISFSPDSSKGLKLIGLINQIDLHSFIKLKNTSTSSNNLGFILCDEKNFIIGTDEKIMNKFGLFPALFENKSSEEKIHISIFSDEFSQSNFSKYFNGSKILTNLNLNNIFNCEFVSKLEIEDLNKLKYAKVILETAIVYRKFEFKNIIFNAFFIDFQNIIYLNDHPLKIINESKDNEKKHEGINLKHKNIILIEEFENNNDMSSVSNSLSSNSTGTSSYIIKYLAEFKSDLNKKIMPKSLIFLDISVVLLILFIIALGIVNFSVRVSLIKSSQNTLKISLNSLHLRIILSTITYNSLSYLNIATGEESNNFGNYKNRNISIFNSIMEDLVKAKSLEDSIYDLRKEIGDTSENHDVKIQAISALGKIQFINMAIDSALYDWIYNTYAFVTTPPNLITTNKCEFRTSILCKNDSSEKETYTQIEQNIFFIKKNFQEGLRESVVKYYENFLQISDNELNYALKIYLIMTIIISFFLLVCLIIIAPIIIRVKNNLLSVLSLFCKLELIRIKKIVNDTQKYLNFNNLEDVQNDFITSNDQNFSHKYEIRKSKNKSQDNKKSEESKLLLDKQKVSLVETDISRLNVGKIKYIFGLIVCIGIIIIVFWIYFIMGYFDVQNIKEGLIDMDNINTRGIGILNCYLFLRLVFLDKGNDNELTLLFFSYMSSYYSDENLVFDFIQNPSVPLFDLKEYLLNLSTDQFCLLTYPSDPNCINLANKILNKGLKNSLFNAMTIGASIQQRFETLNKSSADLGTECSELLNNKEFVEMTIAISRYGREAFINIIEKTSIIFNSYFENLKNREQIIIAITILFLLLIALVFWQIVILFLFREILRSRGILSSIPEDVLLSDEQMRKNIMKIIRY